MLLFVAVIIITALLVILVGVRYYLSPPTRWCRSPKCLVGKTAVITGANTGIGYETALDFAKRGAKVILACRDPKRAAEARDQIIKKTDNSNIFVKIVDMSSFDSVRAFGREMNETEERLDILVNNAGISFGYDRKTEDGYDAVMQINYYSHFLLTHLLIKLMKKSGRPSRIINVSSLAAAHASVFNVNKLEKTQKNLDVYANSKLCNILFTKELAKRLRETNIVTFSLHPGAIKTQIFRTAKGFAKIFLKFFTTLFYKPVADGAQTIVHCSVEEKLEALSGRHFDNCRVVEDYRTACVPGLPLQLWELTEAMVNLKEDEKL